MNKKADSLSFIIVAGLILVLLITSCMILNQNGLDEGCRNLGFSEYKFIGDFQFCKDNNSNLHYIDYECDHYFYIFTKSCDMQTIKIGEVEVAP